jgi:hypothetical protein
MTALLHVIETGFAYTFWLLLALAMLGVGAPRKGGRR